MQEENFNNYIQHYIDFYEGYKTEDKQLKKLININLKNIKNRCTKEIDKQINKYTSAKK